MAQDHWHFCKNCSGMFFDGGAGRGGVCVDGQSEHIAQGFNFALPFGADAPAGQDNWSFCRKCNCLFFVAPGGDPGECAKGGDHDSTGSFTFRLPHDIPEAPGTQQNWRFCRKCNVMHFGGNPGRCVKGDGHDGSGSFNFVLSHDGSFIPD